MQRILDPEMTAPAAQARERSQPLWPLAVVIGLVLILAVLRCVFAATLDLRFDEAYYWTWSKEPVLSFLDHPPLIAWSVRLGTALFGDTLFGVRFAGLVAMALTQLLLADIVRRRTSPHWVWPVVFVVLAMEASLDFSIMTAIVQPDVPLVLFQTALLWALARLDDTRDPKWWLAAGVFGGLMLLSKYSAVFVVPAMLAYLLWPPRNRGWLLTIWPWLAAAIALLLFAPVLIWNAQYDWVSFKFQFARATVPLQFSLPWIGGYIGLQFGLIGPLLCPVVAAGTIIALVRGYRQRDPLLILLTTTAVVPFLYFLWQSGSLRVGTQWTMPIWAAAFAAAAINLHDLVQSGSSLARSATRWAIAAVASGLVIAPAVSIYYLVGGGSPLGERDPIGQAAGYEALTDQTLAVMRQSGATWMATTDYRTFSMFRWEVRDRIPVVQVNERCRFIGFRPIDMGPIRDHPGLWVASRLRRMPEVWEGTSAQFQLLKTIDRVWGNVVYDTYDLELVLNWTPDLLPPPTSERFHCSSDGPTR
jgi:4-amino-4-deoxy-L-arabinose transferase-like glycosyltransferase